MKASVTVSLTPDGYLQVHLPGANGQDRLVELSRNPERMLVNILNGIQAGETAIGQSGAPMSQQIIHAGYHATYKSHSCPFCKAEGLIKPYSYSGNKPVKPTGHRPLPAAQAIFEKADLKSLGF